MKNYLVLLLFAVGTYLSAHTQQPRYKPFFKTDSLAKILPNFDTTVTIWPKSTGNVKFVKDTLYSPVLKSWMINSENYNEPVYAIYTDTIHIRLPEWKKQKNYIENIEKYGPGKVLLFYFRDGTPLTRSDINDLRKYKEIPGQ